MDTKLYLRSVRAKQSLSLQRLFELHSWGFRARLEVAHLVPHATGVRGVMQRAMAGPQWAPFGEFSGIADERLDLPFPGKSELSLPCWKIVQSGLVFFGAD
jgi:hypothetical protein